MTKTTILLSLVLAASAALSAPIRDDLAARNLGFSTDSVPIPYDAQVAYLESTGTQWIDTGFFVDTTTDLVAMRFMPLFGASDYECYFGVQQNIGGMKYFELRKAANTDRIDVTLRINGILTVDEEWHDVALGNSAIEVDGTISTFTAYNCVFTNSLLLFNRSDSGTTTRFRARCKISRFVITRNDEIVLDLLPVRFTNEYDESEGAMYDRVSNSLFRNSGTGSFIIGPDL